METRGRSGPAGGVATSKFAIPRRRPDIVRRPRLNALIDAAIGGKGILIAAPAGYGKTTLVVDWHETSDFAAVWVSLDAWDAELPAFARAVAAAIRLRFDIDVPLGDERFWQPRTVGTVLINCIAGQDEYAVLVLDDLHTVGQSDAVMETVGYVLERAPENLNVIVTSRTRPAVPSLSRLIARREVATLGAGDLAFTPREVRDLLSTLGRSVTDDEAETLYERTEGWAAALILGVGRGDGAPPRSVGVAGANVGLSLADYVHGETLENVPADLRKFLRSIALLPVWTPALCNDVTGRRDSERLLRAAAAQVLFITQHADEPPMYRCHQLLRGLLMQQFRADDPAGFDAAGREAADTLSRFGMLNEAVELLFELEAWDQAAEVLEQIAPRLIQQGQARGLAEWIDRLPREAQARRPYLQVWRARGAYKLQNADEALRLIDDAIGVLRDQGDTRGIVEALFVRGETLRLKGYYHEALEAFGEARALLETLDPRDTRLMGETLRHTGITHTRTGDFDAGVRDLEEGRRLLEQVGDLEGIAHICHSLAECYGRRGEPMQALGALQRARSALERAGNTYDLGANLNNTGMLYYEMGEYEQALQVYDRGLRIVRGASNTWLEAAMMTGIAEAYRNMGRLGESLAMYGEAQPLIEGLQIPDLSAEFTEGLALTRLGLGQGEEAAQLLKSVTPQEADGPARRARHALAQAQLDLTRGDPHAALKSLRIARGYFVEAGERNGKASAAALSARAYFDAKQPRKAVAALEESAELCDELGYRAFLRPMLAGAQDLLEYARARRAAPRLTAALAEAQRSQGQGAEAQPRAQDEPAMLPSLQALAFGRGSVVVGGRQVSDLEWRSEKSKEMLFLLLARKDAVSKEEIFAALWPDLPESKCNSNFHSSLYRLRRAVFRECVVRDASGAYALNPAATFTCDVDSFNDAMLNADITRDEASRVAQLEEAVRHYRGPYLSATYSEWTEPIRRELEDRYVEALNELAAFKLRAGAFEESLALFKALEAVDAYSEAAAYGVMRSYVALNDGASAARHFRRFRQLLKDDLDEEPSPRLVDLYREASSGS